MILSLNVCKISSIHKQGMRWWMQLMWQLILFNIVWELLSLLCLRSVVNIFCLIQPSSGLFIVVDVTFSLIHSPISFRCNPWEQCKPLSQENTQLAIKMFNILTGLVYFHSIKYTKDPGDYKIWSIWTSVTLLCEAKKVL